MLRFILLLTELIYIYTCRVTCRDWFQLSLKEGLTVFRDQVWYLLLEIFTTLNKIPDWSLETLHVASTIGIFIWHGKSCCEKNCWCFKTSKLSVPTGLYHVSTFWDFHNRACAQNVSYLIFLQDSGPMAHPVRPHSYIKVNSYIYILTSFLYMSFIMTDLLIV